MKLSSAPNTSQPSAHKIRKEGGFTALGATLEDTCTLVELDAAWEALDPNEIPGGWMSQLWEVYLDHKDTLEDFEI